MIYYYNNIQNHSSLSTLHSLILNSAMSNKEIDYCRWDAESTRLQIVWKSYLLSSDKSILDNIVSSNCT
jgi:hypothetical protein